MDRLLKSLISFALVLGVFVNNGIYVNAEDSSETIEPTTEISETSAPVEDVTTTTQPVDEVSETIEPTEEVVTETVQPTVEVTPTEQPIQTNETINDANYNTAFSSDATTVYSTSVTFTHTYTISGDKFVIDGDDYKYTLTATRTGGLFNATWDVETTEIYVYPKDGGSLNTNGKVIIENIPDWASDFVSDILNFARIDNDNNCLVLNLSALEVVFNFDLTLNIDSFFKTPSKLVLNSPLQTTYTKDKEVFKSALYDQIDFDNSILPDYIDWDNYDVAKDYLKYDVKVNAYDILTNIIGMDLSSILDIAGPEIAKLIEDLLKTDTYVDIDEAVTIGEYLDNNPLLKEWVLPYLKGDQLNSPLLPSVGTTDVMITYRGDGEYSECSVEGILEVVKAFSSITISTANINYGDDLVIDDLIKTNPEDLNKLVLMVGLDSTVNPFVSVFLPNGLLFDAIEEKYKDGFTLSQITDVLTDLNVIIESEVIDNVLNTIPSWVKDLRVQLNVMPANVGMYFVAAVSMDQNYESSYDVDYLTISPKQTNVTLSFMNEIGNDFNVLFYEDAQSFVFDAVCTQGGEIVETNIEYAYVGINYEGEVVSDTNPIREPGVYTQTAMTLGGNFIATPISRVYIVTREGASIDISSDDKYFYDGDTIEVSSVVKNAEDEVIENAEVRYAYFGWEGADYTELPEKIGKYFVNDASFNDLPTEVGHYYVIAVYFGNSDYALAFDLVEVEIAKGNPTIKINGAVNDESGNLTLEKVYDGEPLDVQYEVDEFVDLSGVTVEYYTREKDSTLAGAPVNAGGYYAVVKVAGTDKYNAAEETVLLFIDKADRGSMSVKNLTVEYTGNSVAGEYDLTKVNTAEIDLNDIVIEYFDQNNAALTSAPVNVGTYTYKVTVPESTNYKALSATGTITINEKVTSGNTTSSENSLSTWDDGGPFTTDICGNVYDRWGNRIYAAPSCKVSDGYEVPNTGVK